MRSGIGSRNSKQNGAFTLYTEACPDPSCTGRLEDVLGTFIVICKDQKHRGGQTHDLQGFQQPRQSLATGMRKNLDDH